jgi:hypothetical protein
MPDLYTRIHAERAIQERAAQRQHSASDTRPDTMPRSGRPVMSTGPASNDPPTVKRFTIGESVIGGPDAIA